MSCKTCAWGGCSKQGENLQSCEKYVPDLAERTRQLEQSRKQKQHHESSK
jgi:hypothetical protein